MAMRLLSKTYWNGSQIRFRTDPGEVDCEAIRLNSADGADIRGVYWTPKSNPRPEAAVIASHPRVDFSDHHAFPALLKAGYACLGGNLRSVNNDMDCVHEKLVLDIARHIRWLKEERGVERVLLLGNSGGGSLFSFYQSQAAAAPAPADGDGSSQRTVRIRGARCPGAPRRAGGALPALPAEPHRHSGSGRASDAAGGIGRDGLDSCADPVRSPAASGRGHCPRSPLGGPGRDADLCGERPRARPSRPLCPAGQGLLAGTER